ncbi:MAG TPA: hypothetical protein VN784_01945, partial [Candidatus Limnocylindrales bacterium]|nr:hypothetical protein [Candidatus Limnocylindrales bacterium]
AFSCGHSLCLIQDPVTNLPQSLLVPLKAQLHMAREWPCQERRAGGLGVWLPGALAPKSEGQAGH